jgi:hypothetical protein
MVMVSPYIKKNTIINAPMSHTSFLSTVHEKWKLPSLSAREDASPGFHDSGLLWPTLQRKKMSDMPVLPAPLVPPDHTDYSKALLSALAKAIIKLIQHLWGKVEPEHYSATMEIKTQGDAAAFLRHAIPRAKLRLGRADALTGQINDEDGVLLLQAIAEELKKRQQADEELQRLEEELQRWELQRLELQWRREELQRREKLQRLQEPEE